MSVLFNARYAVKVEGGWQRGQIQVQADKSTKAKIAARERIQTLTGEAPAWVSVWPANEPEPLTHR